MRKEVNIRNAIINRLIKENVWVAKHISIDTLSRCGVPSHLRGEVRKMIHELLKEGILIYYDRGREAIQLNEEKRKEIYEMSREE